MTETPDGTHAPQHPTTPPQPDPQQPQVEQHPYAGPQWRRPDADTTAPTSAGTAAGTSPQAARAAGPATPTGPGSSLGSGTPAGPPADAPTGLPYSPGWQGAQRPAWQPQPQWPYGPGSTNATAVAERPARSRAGRRFIAVGALTAVLGGLAGGGTVALLDRDGTPVASATGIVRDTGSAPTAASAAGSVEAAAATALKSVVTLNVTGGQESGTGSGVIIRSDGYILTNQHVVAVAAQGGSVTATLADGRTVPATIVGTDTATDLAVVKVNLTGLTAATFADSSAVKVGQTVVAVGSPLGLNGSVTEGIISALHRVTNGSSDDSAVIDALQTDAAINPGNSGGALVDLAGRVVGINQSIATAGSNGGFGGQSSTAGNIGIGFAIPANTAVNIAEQLIASGKAAHAFLGVQTGGSSQQSTASTDGAPIASVEAGGPAAAAGLKAGDVVTKVGDRPITGSQELVAAIRSYAPGDTVTLTVRRGSGSSTVSVTLGSDATQ